MMIELLKRHLDKLGNRFMLFLTISTIIIMSLNYFWTTSYQKRQAQLELREKANIIGVQYQAMRAFVAQKQDIINKDSEGNFEFKHLNPAAVGKGVGDIFSQGTDYSIKQTRLEVRNPENAPDDFEYQMMQKLVDNPELKEVWGEDEIDGKKYFRYLIPLTMEKWCLDCHGHPVGEVDIAGYQKEGYRLGSFGGAISISIPMDNFYEAFATNSKNYLFTTALLIASTLLTTFLLVKLLVADPLQKLSLQTKEVSKGNLDVDLRTLKAYGEINILAKDFDFMAKQLKEMYKHLEQKVEDRTKELREANENLVQANNLQSEFLANMTHELRTPLTSIIAFAELMHEQAEEEGQLEQAENLKDIKHCSHQLLHLINDLLDMAKIEANRMVVNLTSTDLAEVVESVEKTLQPLAKKKNIKLENLIDCQIPLIVADPERLRQIFLNLAGNGIKFTPEGGTITFRAELEKDEVICYVSDNGIGIEAKDLEVIFDKFRQVYNRNSRLNHGTGLGLALTKSLIELHSGEIRVQSTPGSGSTFSFNLKIAKD